MDSAAFPGDGSLGKGSSVLHRCKLLAVFSNKMESCYVEFVSKAVSPRDTPFTVSCWYPKFQDPIDAKILKISFTKQHGMCI